VQNGGDVRGGAQASITIRDGLLNGMAGRWLHLTITVHATKS